MAFSTLNAQQEINNRKILEDLQIKKQLLQKGVNPAVTTINSMPVNTNYAQMNQTSGSDVILNSPSRAAWVQANNQSVGFFVPQDSAFGNNILPVLPRLDNASK